MVAFNPSLNIREHAVRVLVNQSVAYSRQRTSVPLSVDVTVLDATGAVLAAQVNPVFLPGSLKEDKSSYEVTNLTYRTHQILSRRKIN